jgi:peroxiredoxin
VTFVPDPDKKLLELYDVKRAIIGIAKRVTFVIGQDRRITHIDEGEAAIEPAGAVNACTLPTK